MTDAERDPHVLISARIGLSQKLLDLPSHRARWAWIVMLGQAKVQRPQGVFASIQQAKMAAGEFRDCVPHWLDAKLLHSALVAADCKSCREQYPDLAEKAIVVHDFIAHQERKSRTQEWRESVGLTSGHASLGETRGNTGETKGKPSRVRAHAGAMLSHSLTGTSPVEEGPRETTGYPAAGSDRDSLDTYHELTRFRPWGAWSGKALNKAIADYTDERVDAALRQAYDDDPDRDTLMDRAFAALAREAEKRRQSKPRPVRPRLVRDEAAIAAAKRELLGGGVA